MPAKLRRPHRFRYEPKNFNLLQLCCKRATFAKIMFKINYDALGIAASLACAIHCAVLPLVLTSLPIFGVNIINNVLFEFLMIGLAFAIGFYALYHGYRKHHHRVLPIILFSMGILLLFIKEALHQYHFWLLVPAVTFIVS